LPSAIGTCVQTPAAPHTPVEHSLVALHALPGSSLSWHWPISLPHTPPVHWLAGLQASWAGSPWAKHSAPGFGASAHCPAALQTDLLQANGEVPPHALPESAGLATQAPFPSQVGTPQPTSGPHGAPALLMALTLQVPSLPQVPLEQPWPPREQAAPVSASAKHWPAALQVPVFF
jgi:hypothetical protein